MTEDFLEYLKKHKGKVVLQPTGSMALLSPDDLTIEYRVLCRNKEGLFKATKRKEILNSMDLIRITEYLA